jgi:GR25 family glycosyltransferase involved in LPS biosynthesis
MKNLNLYLVHSDHLKNRIKYINTTIDVLSKLARKVGFDVKIKIVKEPSSDFVESNIAVFNKNVKMEKEEGDLADEKFNSLISQLNVYQISNIEKHKAIYSQICAADGSENDFHFIIEDDVIVGQDYLENIEKCFQDIYDDKLVDWDILFTCSSSINQDSMSLINSRDPYKILLNKSSYFIRPDVASRLKEYLNVYRYNLKIAISKFIWDDKSIRSCVLNKHTLLEGSKIGIFPSSVNSKNYLYQNINYVNLVKITNADTIDDEQLQKAEGIFKDLKYLESPDVLHTMGILYFKRADYTNAKIYMSDACEKLFAAVGSIAKSSEIMSNSINIFQYDQPQLEECKKTKSKYLS